MSRGRIIVHGGTSLKEDQEEKKELLVKEAASLGLKILKEENDSTLAVAGAIAFLENTKEFGAGGGSSVQIDCITRYDASIMNSEWKAGAVLGITDIKNPILAALKVMKETNHLILAGEVASIVLREMGCEQADTISAITSKDYSDIVKTILSLKSSSGFSTVGAVALDTRQILSSGTSSGGLKIAMPGRSGDSGIIGAGTIATPQVAVSCTGWGERFILYNIAHRVACSMELGNSLQDATEWVYNLLVNTATPGGFIALDTHGNSVIKQNVPYMRYCLLD